MTAIIGGIIAIAIGLWLVFPGPLGQAFKWFLGGGLVFLLILGGLIAIAAGISDIKDKIEERKEKEEEAKKESEGEKKES
jgi:Na+-transporting methylmalonyl-CoA/oxaloacetate decarboxylase gamma subunit